MPRLAKFDEGRILDAAAKLVASRGPNAATVAAIGSALGAPSGSIYHRFRSRDALLGRLWLSKATIFQDRWAAALQISDPIEAGLQAALSMPQVVREDINGARVMLLYRREDFVSDEWPSEMKAEAEALGRQVKDGLSDMARRLFGRDSAVARRTTAFATIDIPYSAVRRYVSDSAAPPAHVDALISRVYHAVVDEEVRDASV